MIAVGNDVIDLEDPEARTPHPRFGERIGVPDGEVWPAFAAKEAAFKALRKIEPEVRPIPRRFSIDREQGVVRYGALCARWIEVRGAGYVHAVAVVGRPHVVADVARLGAGCSPAEQSREARRRLLAAVGAELGISTEELRVVRDADAAAADGRGPPRIYRGGQRLQVDVSLSHHGRWVAWAAAFATPGLECGVAGPPSCLPARKKV